MTLSTMPPLSSFKQQSTSKSFLKGSQVQGQPQKQPTKPSSNPLFDDQELTRLLPFLNHNKPIHQVVERLKKTPDYLEQIAEEKKQKYHSQILKKSQDSKQTASILAIKGRNAHFEDIFNQALLRNAAKIQKEDLR